MKQNPSPYSNREFRSRKRLHIPAYIVYIRGVLRTGSSTRPYDANPGMPPTGLLKFSKRGILKYLPESVRPQTLLWKTSDKPSDESIKALGSPFICKPDGEERGSGVTIIQSWEQREIHKQLLESDRVFLLQEYIDYPEEIGIFRYRNPDTAQGIISGITTKQFSNIIGDGKTTLGELITHHERAKKYQKVFFTNRKEKRETIVPNGESVQLNALGNHRMGTKFMDSTNLITPALTASINNIMNTIPNFHYGRLDLRCTSLQDLQEGKLGKVLEINGAQSEPTHMYDPHHTLREWCKEITWHWCMLLRIALHNRKQGKSLHIPLLAHLKKTYVYR